MIKKIFLLLFVFVFVDFCHAQPENKIVAPEPVKIEKPILIENSNSQLTYPTGFDDKDAKNDPELSSLEWNRYVVGNFSILSIDNNQGLWLSKNIDLINQWCTTRWGFSKVKFSKECRIFCVPNKSLLNKLFGLNDSRVEVRKKDGELEMSVIWVAIEDSPAVSLSPLLTRASFLEFENQEFSLPWWFVRSAEIINSPIPDIRSFLSDVDLEGIDLEKTISTDYDAYQVMTKEAKKTYDQECLILCLLLRKEFGEIKLHALLKLLERNSPESVLKIVYGYSSLKEFDSKYKLYAKDLSTEMKSKKVPDSYLNMTSSSLGNN